MNKNFDLRIEKSDGDNWQAEVIYSPAGEASNQFKLPFEIEKWQAVFRSVARSSEKEGGEQENSKREIEPLGDTEGPKELGQIKDFGTQLFEAVFDAKNVGRVFRNSLEKAKEEKFDLRLRLRLDSPELTELPWEYLYDPDDERFITLLEEIPILRYLEVPIATESLKVNLPLEVLVVTANPKRYAHLNIEEEWQRLENAVKNLKEAGEIRLTRLQNATFQDLQQELDKGKTKYHIFHFIGHGGFDRKSGEGTLIFENKAQNSHSVSSEKLSTILCNHDSLRLAFLNACEGAQTGKDPFAGVAQALVKQGIPAVIAMQFKITDDSAIALAESFYQDLVAGEPVGRALTVARRTIFTREGDSFEWGTPVLFMRSEQDRLFELTDSPINLPTCPYKGLAAFKEEDKDDFFGRERFTQKLLNAVNEKSLVVLVGNSGSGKSSVVFAGLVPRLSKEEWIIADFRPHGEPFRKLASSFIEYLEGKLSKRERLKEVKRYAQDFKSDSNELRLVDVIEDILNEHNKSLLIIIDQFEELFTLTANKDLQHKFLGHLVEAAQKELPNFKLLLTMRSDFISHSLGHAEFGQELSENMLTLTAMSREELCEVIEEPAKKEGVTLID